MRAYQDRLLKAALAVWILFRESGFSSEALFFQNTPDGDVAITVKDARLPGGAVSVRIGRSEESSEKTRAAWVRLGTAWIDKRITDAEMAPIVAEAVLRLNWPSILDHLRAFGVVADGPLSELEN